MEAYGLKLEFLRSIDQQIPINAMRSRIRVRIKVESWIRISIKKKIWIRIRVKVMRISNPDFDTPSTDDLAKMFYFPKLTLSWR
jgi:hypothetical protein